MSEPIRMKILKTPENVAMLERSRIIAIFVEVDDQYGLMVQNTSLDDIMLSKEEKEALIQAAQALPTRD